MSWPCRRTEQAELPGFVRQYIDRNGLALEHGTVVVWVEPDRLTYRSPAFLKEHLVEDFGVTYRYLLQRDGHDVTDRHFSLIVEGTKVGAVDPLFLLPGARLYVSPEDGGSQLIEDRTLPVKFATDPETGEKRLTMVEDQADLAGDDPETVISTIQVRIARFPVGFAEIHKGKGEKRGPPPSARYPQVAPRDVLRAVRARTPDRGRVPALAARCLQRAGRVAAAPGIRLSLGSGGQVPA